MPNDEWDAAMRHCLDAADVLRDEAHGLTADGLAALCGWWITLFQNDLVWED